MAIAINLIGSLSTLGECPSVEKLSRIKEREIDSIESKSLRWVMGLTVNSEYFKN